MLLILLNTSYAQLWQDVNVDFDRPPRKLFADRIDGRLYAVGFMETMNGQAIDGIAYYDGHGWERLPAGNAVRQIGSVTRYRGNLLIGGVEGLSVWNGSTWRNLFPECTVGGIVALNGKCLVMGAFRDVSPDSIVGMAVLEDSLLLDSFRIREAMPPEDMVGVLAVAMFRDKLVAAGGFSDGNRKAVMQWDGQTWQGLGAGLGGGGSVWVNDMEVYRGELYVAGHFDETQGCPGDNIARWDGTLWRRVGEGLGFYGQVFDLMQHEGRLYAAGSFSNVSGMPSIGYAVWDGLQWCTVGDDIDNAIGDMAVYRDEIYVAGGFRVIGGDSIRYLAKWTGGAYVETCRAFPETPEHPLPVDRDIRLVPNPATAAVWLQGMDSSEVAEVGLIDMQGRQVLARRPLMFGEQLDVSHLSAGVYVVEVRARGRMENVKLVKN